MTIHEMYIMSEGAIAAQVFMLKQNCSDFMHSMEHAAPCAVRGKAARGLQKNPFAARLAMRVVRARQSMCTCRLCLNITEGNMRQTASNPASHIQPQ